MNNLAYKYISTISFSDLYNWSFQYAQKCENLFTNKYKCVSIGSFLVRIKDPVDIEDNQNYKRVSIKLYNGGITLRDIELGVNIGTKKQFRIKQGHFLLSKIDARNGAIGIVPESCNDAIITGNFWDFEIDTNKADPQFLSLLMTTDYFVKLFDKASNGTTNRHYLQEDLFLKTEIPLPSLDIQKEFVKKYNDKIKLAQEQEQKANGLEKNIEKYIFEMLGLKISKNSECAKLQFVNFMNVKLWGIDKISGNNAFSSSKYKLCSLADNRNLYLDAFRGKSPKYEDNTNAIILNQKCNRWNSIDLQYAKTVSEAWLNSIDGNFQTKENDIIVNSTGEGTIGRATCIDDEHTGLLYDSHMLLLRLNTEFVNPLYYTYLLNSSFGQEQISYIKSAQSTKQTELGIDNLKLIKFPYPELDTQNEIVEHIKELNNNIIHLRKQAEQNRIAAQEEFEKELFE